MSLERPPALLRRTQAARLGSLNNRVRGIGRASLKRPRELISPPAPTWPLRICCVCMPTPFWCMCSTLPNTLSAAAPSAEPVAAFTIVLVQCAGQLYSTVLSPVAPTHPPCVSELLR
jgi:hypothetical protein